MINRRATSDSFNIYISISLSIDTLHDIFYMIMIEDGILEQDHLQQLFKKLN